jgi:hypothetical protein
MVERGAPSTRHTTATPKLCSMAIWAASRRDLLVGYRRLQVRYERRADILLGFLGLACAPICLKACTGPR